MCESLPESVIQTYILDHHNSGDCVYFRFRYEAMGHLCVLFHPSYMRKDELMEWIMNIDFDTSPIYKNTLSLSSMITPTSIDTPHSFLFYHIRKKVA